MKFTIREANTHDIQQIQFIRHAVKENILSDPSLVTDADCELFLTERGKGWVAEIDDFIVGFAVADEVDQNIWALFIHPDFEGKGIGKSLHATMLNWYFSRNHPYVWLSTDPHTRAEGFYTAQGWTKAGTTSNGEVKFEMTVERWRFKS